MRKKYSKHVLNRIQNSTFLGTNHLELINVMLEEYENPNLLDEPIDKKNFIDIMCKNYSDDQIITKLYKTNLVKKKKDIEVINQFIIKPKIIDNKKK